MIEVFLPFCFHFAHSTDLKIIYFQSLVVNLKVQHPFIIKTLQKDGRFTNRTQLMNVKKLGPKAYQQCAGFLRITDGEEPLDQTSIHPESYAAARALMNACGITSLGAPDAAFPEDKVKDLGIDSYTLKDIEDSIRQPLRDYRDQFEGALLRSDVLEMSDLHVGDKLSGTVRNVVDFGAFVDIGLHEDGLVHTTRMSMRRNVDPMSVVSVGDIVDVWVYELDEARGRVSLSMIEPSQLEQRDAAYKQAISLYEASIASEGMTDSQAASV